MSTSGTNGIDPELLRVRRDSRNCRTCGGDGLAIVFHPRWAGSRVSRIWNGEIDDDGNQVVVPTAMEVAAHCICALGRWIRERTDRDMLPFIPDVERIVEGSSQWLLEQPPYRRTAEERSQEARSEADTVRVGESIVRDARKRQDVFTAA